MPESLPEWRPEAAAPEKPFDVAGTRVPRRRRSRRVFAVVGALVVLVIVAAVLLDGVARNVVANLIESKVRSSLSLPASAPVDVTIGGSSVLLQLAAGRLQTVTIAVDDLAVGELRGNAVITATGVPTDTSKPIDHGSLVFTAGQSELSTLLTGFDGLPITSVALADGAVNADIVATVFGMKLPITVALAPKAIDGQLGLTPKSLTLSGATLSPSAVRASLGSVADSLLATQKVCVAKYLPRAFWLDSVSVRGSNLRLSVSASSFTLNSDLFSSKGVCP
ncbi:MAG: hypothetical protein JWM49_1077 [Microbacteriaceae bacterium]|nr:hypothetical protein [Microbacteriaceae bacterium]